MLMDKMVLKEHINMAKNLNRYETNYVLGIELRITKTTSVSIKNET